MGSTRNYDFNLFAIMVSILCITTMLALLPVVNSQAVYAQEGSGGGRSEKVEVMILGAAHFGNPGQDVINNTFPDVFQPKYQRQIARVIDSLAQFKPTKVALEARPDDEPVVDSLYHAYRQGRHTLSRNERQQLGFRLAGRFNHVKIYCVDHDGAFPFRKVLAFAREHQPEIVNHFNSVREKVEQFNDSLYSNATIPEILRYKNSPENLQRQRNYYAKFAAVGNDTTWPGVDLVSKWHRRNIKIFADLSRKVEPGDRVIVIFGTGHAPLLRYFVESNADMTLVEPVDFL